MKITIEIEVPDIHSIEAEMKSIDEQLIALLANTLQNPPSGNFALSINELLTRAVSTVKNAESKDIQSLLSLYGNGVIKDALSREVNPHFDSLHRQSRALSAKTLQAKIIPSNSHYSFRPEIIKQIGDEQFRNFEQMIYAQVKETVESVMGQKEGV
jgi:hypothetical protein